jgi:hypothetical protein
MNAIFTGIRSQKKEYGMTSKPTKSKVIAPAAIAIQHRPLAGTDTFPVEVYRVPGRHPVGDGPWSAEADKVSWIDPDSGLPCIMRRGVDGALCGYVGVGPDHPLAGVAKNALPHDPQIVVHGGVSYAAACEERDPPQVSVCHVRAPRKARRTASNPLEALFDERAREALAKLPEDVWWFGFACNHSYDLIPKNRLVRPLGLETGRVYRDERYVVRETNNLAAQLHAIAHGLPMPELKGERPPLGSSEYDPVKRR